MTSKKTDETAGPTVGRISSSKETAELRAHYRPKFDRAIRIAGDYRNMTGNRIAGDLQRLKAALVHPELRDKFFSLMPPEILAETGSREEASRVQDMVLVIGHRCYQDSLNYERYRGCLEDLGIDIASLDEFKSRITDHLRRLLSKMLSTVNKELTSWADVIHLYLCLPSSEASLRNDLYEAVTQGEVVHRSDSLDELFVTFELVAEEARRRVDRAITLQNEKKAAEEEAREEEIEDEIESVEEPATKEALSNPFLEEVERIVIQDPRRLVAHNEALVNKKILEEKDRQMFEAISRAIDPLPEPVAINPCQLLSFGDFVQKHRPAMVGTGLQPSLLDAYASYVRETANAIWQTLSVRKS